MGRRTIRRLAAAVAVVAVTPVAWSYTTAMTRRGSDPAGVRTVEWLRGHHMTGVVNWTERTWYSHHQPKAGGTPQHGLPTVPAPAADAPSATGLNDGTAPPGVPPTITVPASAPSRPNPRRPADIAPLASTPLPGEGVWRPVGRAVGGEAAVYAAFLRPDDVHTSLVAGVAWMDTTKLRATLFAGDQEPGGGPWRNEAPVPVAERPALVAAFNGGFRMNDARSGFYADGRAVRPLRDGQASFTIDAQGRPNVVEWGRDTGLTPDIVAVRQNLPLIVDGGRLAPGLNDESRGRWGFTLGNRVLVWRSGAGVDAAGNLIYAAGNGLSVESLARLLQRAGAVRAMELDINSTWVTYDLFQPAAPGNPAIVVGSKLLPDMRSSANKYLGPESRDFVAMFG